MTIERKVGMGIAGQPTGPGPDVAEVFSVHTYTSNNADQGSGATQTINNGIDLAGEGGLVWIKNRNNSRSHVLIDTERGAANSLSSNSNAVSRTDYTGTNGSGAGASFNSNGFTVGDRNEVNASNGSSTPAKYVSWTFRKKKKFFDVVTYTGNGVAGREIAHGLDGPVGMMIVKDIDTSTSSWATYHKSLGATKYMYLEATGGANTHIGFWNDTEPTDSVFTIGSLTAVNNVLGDTYVAYLFADNSAEDAEDQMIKCGSFTGTGSAGLEVNLGWEPQWVLIKNTSRATGWMMQDTMRGMSHNGWQYLLANDNAAESGDTSNRVVPTATGFTVNNNGGNDFGQSGDTLVYMAIRAPMMKEPEAATDVFAVNSRGTTAATAAGVVYHSGFPVDLALEKNVSQVTSISAFNRLNGSLRLQTDNNSAATDVTGDKFGSMDGFDVRVLSANTGKFAWMWKRAKGYMDVVCYNGAASASTVPHSLGVVPEMIWTKYRNGEVSWAVYHSGIGNTKHLRLDDYHAQIGGTNFWNNTTPTDTHFTVGTDGETGHSAGIYTAYLFATLEGISKVGSYTGNGSSQTIDCGFSAGSRFILIKRTDATGSWYLWDSARGIVAGDEPNIFLDTTSDQNTTDSIDPHNSGFIVNQVSSAPSGQSVIYPNVSGGTYIFYAIA